VALAHAIRPAFGPDGEVVWTHSPTGAHGGSVHGIAVDADGNAYVSATLRGVADFGTGQIAHEDGDFALIKSFVARYTSDGTVRWAVRIGGAGLQVVSSVAADGSGNVFAAGTFSGPTHFGSIRVSSCGPWGFTDPFLTRLGPDGTVLWVRRGCAESGDGEGAGVAVDGSGNTVFAGIFLGTVRFSDTTFRSQGWWDSFVVRYAPDGTEVWAGHLAGPSDVYAEGVAISAGGDAIYVAGGFDGEMTIGASTVSGAGSHDAFLARLVP
jgi:hypothetical protein